MRGDGWDITATDDDDVYVSVYVEDPRFKHGCAEVVKVYDMGQLCPSSPVLVSINNDLVSLDIHNDQMCLGHMNKIWEMYKLS